MRLYRVGPVLLLAVLISCQLVSCESDGNESLDSATETIEICTKDVPDSKQIPVTTETNKPLVEMITISDPLTDVIAFEESDANRFFDVLKKQMKCGYPKFGVPSMVPLKLSYKFKTSLDLLSLKKVQISASNFVIHGLDNFSWKSSNTSFSRSKANLMLNFPNVTVTADTSLNRANGTSRLSLYDILVYVETKYEEKDDQLYVTDLDGDLAVRAATVKLDHLFPKSAKLTRIWNKAIGDSLPVVTKLITSRKLSVDFINRIINGSRYYVMNTINTALTTYKMSFDRLVESIQRFSDKTYDSLMCNEDDLVEQSRVL
ncbi:uncharacterized protein LOC135699539 [Ochlerotatus camptorhynchus]|uniref:uncharacterized protein LOC135699539 n=1 Tax=Ochlerotatus camptorhynchus TaxID=644619 RepID=UPI0031E195A5